MYFMFDVISGRFRCLNYEKGWVYGVKVLVGIVKV